MNRRDFLKRSSLTAFVLMIGINVVQKSLIPERKLKAVWTCELEQDLKCLHGLDVDCEAINEVHENIINVMAATAKMT